MSCKYCKPLPSTKDTEPLLEHEGLVVMICGNKLGICDDHGYFSRITIDFCPNCGEALKPFGSLLFSRYGDDPR